MEKFLNLGCGSRICGDPRWVNVDFFSTREGVIRHNLLEGIPFPDGSFDAVYSSHVLEHFRREDGKRLVRECNRVIRSGGVARFAVPDLEQICRLYLSALEGIRAGEESWRDRYDWVMLEMYDQAVRTRPGGEMEEYLHRKDLRNREFVLSRIGGTGRGIMNARNEDLHRESRGEGGRLRGVRRNLLLRPPEREALALGLFRLSGEVHQWMYDEWSLGELLGKAGFLAVRRCSAAGSGIPGWSGFGLDIDPDGLEHAPNSLYMEGTAP